MTSADHVVPAAAAAHRLKAGRGLHLATIIWKIRRLEVKGSLMHLALRLAARGDRFRVAIQQDLLFSAEADEDAADAASLRRGASCNTSLMQPVHNTELH